MSSIMDDMNVIKQLSDNILNGSEISHDDGDGKTCNTCGEYLQWNDGREMYHCGYCDEWTEKMSKWDCEESYL